MADKSEHVHLESRVAELEAQARELQKAYDEEVDEFNAGFQAYQDSLPDDTPRDDPHDVWLCGYAWAAYEDLKKQVRELTAERDRLKEDFAKWRGRAVATAKECQRLNGVLESFRR